MPLFSRSLRAERARGRTVVSMRCYAADIARKAESEWKADGGGESLLMAFESHQKRSNVEDKKVSGMRTLKDFLIAVDIVNEHAYALSQQQSEIMMLNIQCVLKQMFSDDELIQHLMFLLDFFDIDELFQDLIVEMRRRGGKTIVLSCFIAIFIVVMPKGNTNVFSSGARISKAMKEVIRGVVLILMEKSERFSNSAILVDNQEQLVIRTMHGTQNILNVFPCNEKIGASDPFSTPPPSHFSTWPFRDHVEKMRKKRSPIRFPPPLSSIRSINFLEFDFQTSLPAMLHA